jgi:hypothetical protein
VPVSHEDVTLERAPITAANRGAAHDGRAISEEEHEVTLHAERPVVDTEAVPVERVRLSKETVADQETVVGEVRKEEVEFDTATPASATTRAADLAVGAVSSEVGWDESLADLHTLSTRAKPPGPVSRRPLQLCPPHRAGLAHHHPGAHAGEPARAPAGSVRTNRAEVDDRLRTRGAHRCAGAGSAVRGAGALSVVGR